MPHMTDAEIEQVKTYWANHPASTYAEVGKVFGVDKSTVWRIINRGTPYGENAPFIDTPEHEATDCNTLGVAVPYTPPRRKEPRIEPIIAGAKDQGKEIMKKLDLLMQEQELKLDNFMAAQADLIQELEGKELPPLEAYKAAMQINNDFNTAILGIRGTLNQMARVSQGLNMYVDNRKILNVHYDQLPPKAKERMDEAVTERLMEDMWPLLCDGCREKFVQLTKMEPIDEDEPGTETG